MHAADTIGIRALLVNALSEDAKAQALRHQITEQRLVERDEQDETKVGHHHRYGQRDRDAPARGRYGFEWGL